MNIVYADDDQLSLEIVLRALESRGHRVTIVNSSKVKEMLRQFQQVLVQDPLPQLVILDGHNVATDAEGKPIADLQPDLLMNWLQRNGLPDNTRFVLYSSDDHLIAQTRANQVSGFFAAVPKVGSQGGLNALLTAVEKSFV